MLFCKAPPSGPVLRLYNSFYMVYKLVMVATLASNKYHMNTVLLIVFYIIMIMHDSNALRMGKRHKMSRAEILMHMLIDLISFPLLFIPLAVVENQSLSQKQVGDAYAKQNYAIYYLMCFMFFKDLVTLAEVALTLKNKFFVACKKNNIMFSQQEIYHLTQLQLEQQISSFYSTQQQQFVLKDEKEKKENFFKELFVQKPIFCVSIEEEPPKRDSVQVDNHHSTELVSSVQDKAINNSFLENNFSNNQVSSNRSQPHQESSQNQIEHISGEQQPV